LVARPIGKPELTNTSDIRVRDASGNAGPPTGVPRIELVDLTKTFPSQNPAAAAVRGVSLSVMAGEVFGVIGESGAGKSTLIRLINRLERPTGGKVLIDGEDIGRLSPEALRQLRRRMGMIFQHFNLLSSRTVAQNVAFPLRMEGKLGLTQIRAKVGELLDRVGLAAAHGQYPAQLSGGQKQRVGIARALACDPTILLCDEATSALDPETTSQTLDLLAELNHDLGLTIMLITHEMDVVRRVCDRVAVLDSGQVVETGGVIDVFLDAQHKITRRLLGEDVQVAPTYSGGRSVQLTYRGVTGEAPFLSQIIKDTGVDLTLHAARVAHIKREPYGQLTVSLAGARVDEALAQLSDAGVRVRDLRR
jgi:D-methionine transport system ATP-binding protein